MIVARVSALDGDEVTLGVLDRVEDQGTVNDRKGSHGIQRLVAEVAHGGIGAVLGLVGQSRDLYRVVTGGELGEVDVLGGGADGLLVEDSSVGGGDLQSVGGGTHHGIPLHRGGGDTDLGGGKLGALGSPDGVEGHVGGQNGFLGELGGQLVPVTVHAGEPAVEYVALTGRDRQRVELAAHGGRIGQSICTLVAQHEADGVLGRARDLFSPAGVKHGVGLNEGGVEVEGSLQPLVGIPAQENEAVPDGVGGLGGGSAVDHVSVLHHAAAVGVIADGEADLLAEGHDGLAKGQNQVVALQRSGGGTLLVLVEVEGDHVFADGILTRRVVAGARQRELIAAAESQLQFTHLQIVVVDTCFHTLGGGSGVRHLALGSHAQYNGNHHGGNEQHHGDHKGVEPFVHILEKIHSVDILLFVFCVTNVYF